MSGLKIIFLYILLTFLITNICSKTSYKEKYSKILTKSYKSDLQFIFDEDYDFQSQKEDENIRKYFHKYMDTYQHLMNGARMRCYTPSKIAKFLNGDSSVEKMEKISEEYAQVFLREPTKLCFNSNVNDWFYNICPMKSAKQVLTYQKKD